MSDLVTAAAGAQPGTCLVVANGSYPEVTLPAGVSLLGPGAACVDVAGLTLQAGGAAKVRGVTVGAGGVIIEGGATVSMDQIRVEGSHDRGIWLQAGASVVELHQSAVVHSTTYGIEGLDGVHLTVEKSVIADNEAGGLRLNCESSTSEECGCVDRPTLVMRDSMIRDNRIAGVALFEAATMSVLERSIIRGTKVGDSIHFGEGGGGLSVAACSDVVVSAVLVDNNRSYGVLVEHAQALFQTPALTEVTDVAIEAGNNERGGLWLNRIVTGQLVEVQTGEFDANDGVGIGAGFSPYGGEVMGIPIICYSDVSNTIKADLPAIDEGMPGTTSIGHGLSWNDGAPLDLDTLSLAGSDLEDLLIDGGLDSQSEVLNLSISKMSAVQQNCGNSCDKPGGDQDSLNLIAQQAGQKHPIPAMPAIP